jgi:hypothetical protein
MARKFSNSPVAGLILAGSVAAALLGVAVNAHAKALQECAPKKHASVPVITGSTYHKARKILLAKGWQPYQTISHNAAPTESATAYGNGQIFWSKGYIEVEACSGMGAAPCSFLFTDVYGTLLRVLTRGEEIPKEKAYAGVSGFRFVCY